uniref:DUF3456 domain-containing protein n=2 Tax=Clastoptera arizonana TaxID=38151 RepID=A0A1B6CCV6_9HEMI
MSLLTQINFILVIFSLFKTMHAENAEVKRIQCLVCQAVVNNIEKEIEKISPSRKLDVSLYSINDVGNREKESIEYRRSEVFLSEVFDDICNSMEDWVKAKYKSNGQLVVFPLLIDDKMNPIMNEVDIIQDSNLNKNIKLYCEMIFEEHEDTLMTLFRQGTADIDIKLCSQMANLCNETTPDEEYEFEREDL